jgi:hypothetical protein
MSETSYRSTKSHSTFVVTGEPRRAYLNVYGEAATNAKVKKEVDRIRISGGTFTDVAFTARELARTY